MMIGISLFLRSDIILIKKEEEKRQAIRGKPGRKNHDKSLAHYFLIIKILPEGKTYIGHNKC